MKSSASESKPFQSRSKGEIPGWARRKEWLSHSKLKQAFLIYSDAKLFMYLIQCIRFGSWKVWRLNGTLLFRIIFCSKLSLKHLTTPSTFTHTFTCALDFTRSWCILDWACVRQRKCVYNAHELHGEPCIHVWQRMGALLAEVTFCLPVWKITADVSIFQRLL